MFVSSHSVVIWGRYSRLVAALPRCYSYHPRHSRRLALHHSPVSPALSLHFRSLTHHSCMTVFRLAVFRLWRATDTTLIPASPFTMPLTRQGTPPNCGKLCVVN